MPVGISPKLPLAVSAPDGYRLTKTPAEAVKQNFKNLILTSPGERVMIPEFGVGLRRYLFEQQSTVTIREIRGRIQEQVSIYLPYVKINSIKFFSGAVAETSASEEIFSLDEFNFSFEGQENLLYISISYEITSLNILDVLSVTVS
tara:strand:+ start:61 stop:498 length:438 start_codon:yes stop_codon:yes gene_type:complete